MSGGHLWPWRWYFLFNSGLSEALIGLYDFLPIVLVVSRVNLHFYPILIRQIEQTNEISLMILKSPKQSNRNWIWTEGSHAHAKSPHVLTSVTLFSFEIGSIEWERKRKKVAWWLNEKKKLPRGHVSLIIFTWPTRPWPSGIKNLTFQPVSELTRGPFSSVITPPRGKSSGNRGPTRVQSRSQTLLSKRPVEQLANEWHHNLFS